MNLETILNQGPLVALLVLIGISVLVWKNRVEFEPDELGALYIFGVLVRNKVGPGGWHFKPPIIGRYVRGSVAVGQVDPPPFTIMSKDGVAHEIDPFLTTRMSDPHLSLVMTDQPRNQIFKESMADLTREINNAGPGDLLKPEYKEDIYKRVLARTMRSALKKGHELVLFVLQDIDNPQEMKDAAAEREAADITAEAIRIKRRALGSDANYRTYLQTEAVVEASKKGAQPVVILTGDDARDKANMAAFIEGTSRR